MKHNPNYYPLTEFDAVRELVGGSICYVGRTKEYIFRDGQNMPPQNEIDAKLSEMNKERNMKFLRVERDKKLTEVDWWTTRSNDTGIPLTQEQKDYKQALRDITINANPKLENGQLTNITWPTKPE